MNNATLKGLKTLFENLLNNFLFYMVLLLAIILLLKEAQFDLLMLLSWLHAVRQFHLFLVTLFLLIFVGTVYC
jgi:hypothetical protein